MTLSLNEIKKRAIEFSSEWKDETSEDAEAKSFWDGFFNIFGISRKRVASFEEPVKKLNNKTGFIDLFWKGTLLVEHKSRGKNLDKAYSQAIDYFPGIEEDNLPKYILVSDFQRFRLYDIEENIQNEFELNDLHNNIHLFNFILGHTQKKYVDEDPVNIKAAELMGKLHDILKENGYTGHQLEMFLVRIMFCLFADDTGIFNKDHFTYYIETKTNVDGTDLGIQLANIFQILNTPEEKRQKNIDEDLDTFRYINGKLFEEKFDFPQFDSAMRKIFLNCCHFDWSKVSPAIFGSMFQSVMYEVARHELGAHYTSEKNILKIVKSLFLDDLYNEFEKNKTKKNELEKLLDKIKNLKILDPACGCGNFLIISYRELRTLEIKIHKAIDKIVHGTSGNIDFGNFKPDLKNYLGINVDSMYGIEIEEFPSRIAQVALWIVDHQMNMLLSEEFGDYIVRLPLTVSANIINDNALKLDWEKIILKNELNFILGNPPFISKQNRTKEQNLDMDLIFNNKIKNYGILDYVTCWYIKAADFIKGTEIKVGFVSTNSITQGEQVGVLWDYLLKINIKIHFAHRTFKWSNEARNNAGVYVVLIGITQSNVKNKFIYDYQDVKGEPYEVKVENINPYLINHKDFIIQSRNNPICNVPQISFGSMPNDDGNFLFNDDEKNDFLNKEPNAEKFFKPLISAKEYLNNEKRWCLWLVDIKPSEIKSLPLVTERIENVKQYRIKSTREATRKLAYYPNLFGEIRQPESDYILIPLTTSENRHYIPMNFLSKNNIANNSCSIIPTATFYELGILMSTMHMAWVRQVCGRLEGRYRYSNNIVYNNFPWPEMPDLKKYNQITETVKELLKIREEYKDEKLADLYDPVSMPKKLIDIHKKLDKAVDLCYRSQPFVSELNRIEFLFDLYEKYTSLFKEKNKK